MTRVKKSKSEMKAYKVQPQLTTKKTKIGSNKMEELSNLYQRCPICHVKSAWGFPYSRVSFCYTHNPMNSIVIKKPIIELKSLKSLKVLKSPIFFDSNGMRDIRKEAEIEVAAMSKKEKKRFIKEYEAHIKDIEEERKMMEE